MTLLYGGSQFIGVDNDAIGDGTGGDTQPLDAWLQTRIQANLEYLADEPRLLCFSPVITNANDYATVTGIRPYTHAVNAGTVWLGRVIGAPGLTSISLTIAYSSFCVSGNGGQGDVKTLLTVVSPRGKIGTLSSTLPETETGGTPDVGVATLEVTFDEPLLQTEDLKVTLLVETDGDFQVGESTTLGDGSDGIEAYSTGDGYGRGNFLGSAAGTFNDFWVDSASGNPDADSIECMFVRVGGSDWATSGYSLDLLQSGDDNSTGTLAFVYPPHDEFVGEPQAGGLAYTAYLTQSFFLRAAAIEFNFEESTLDIDREKLHGNQVLGGAESYAQHAAMRIIHRRPRLVAMGPRGFKDSDCSEYDNLDYALHWPFTFGDETGDEQVLIEDSIYLTSVGPDLVLDLTFICIQHETTFNLVNNSGFASTDAKESFSQKWSDDDLLQGDGSEPGRVQWDLDINLDQLDDGATGNTAWGTDSTSYLDVTETISTPLLPASFRNGATTSQPPVAIGADAAAYSDKKSGGRDGNFWYKEGSLFEGSKDAGYLKSVRLYLETSNVTQTTNKLPYRFKVSAALDEVVDWLNSAGSPTDDIRLMLVSYTLHELPKDPSITASEALSNPVATAETGTLTFGGITGEAP